MLFFHNKFNYFILIINVSRYISLSHTDIHMYKCIYIDIIIIIIISVHYISDLTGIPTTSPPLPPLDCVSSIHYLKYI